MSIKYWKYLQIYANIVWVCEREDTGNKLIKFAKYNGLRLDAVYQIIRKKNKKMLTVSYHTIEAEYDIKPHKINSPLKLKS